MLDTMFQHPGKVQCDLYLCLNLRTRFIFKESTPYFLLVKLRVFSLESEHLLFPERVLSTKETLDVHEDLPNDVPTY